jgi:cytochrome c peroxidase
MTIPLISCVLTLVGAAFLAGCEGSGSSGGGTAVTSLDPPAEPEPPGDQPAFPFIAHVSQANIAARRILFDELFVLGDELFEAAFNTLDGSGILRLPDLTAMPARYSRVPPGGGRFTGPNGQACSGCHNTPFGTSAGEAASNVVQDPAGLGMPPFNLRNTISLFGAGVIQRLAEEMTDELVAIRDAAAAAATPGGPPVTMALAAQGIAFGSITAMRNGGGTLSFDTSAVEGVSADLIIRPFGWKGDVPSLRQFVRGAANNELGMEPDELVAKHPMMLTDPDGDGVEGEFSVGDITALTIYIAAQESPTTFSRMISAGILAPPGRNFLAQAGRGRAIFDTIGCGGCHVAEFRVADPVFNEPTLRGAGGYFDASMAPPATELDPARPAPVHLVQQGDFPRPVPHSAGGLRAPIFGDLRRHNMGSQLADAQPQPVANADGSQLMISGAPVFVGVQEFLTAELWGVGDTGSWLHDGRAASLEEAIDLHGVDSPPAVGNPARSEAQEERDAFLALVDGDREAVVTFLRSLILVNVEEE